MTTRIKNAVFITDRLEKNKYLYVNDGKISAFTECELPFDDEIDANGKYVSAGFIDIHTHGAGGYDFSDGGVDDIINACRMLASHGVTTVYPTSPSISFDDIKLFVKNVRSAMQKNRATKAHIAGAHLEGPYFSQSQRGAQNPEFIKNPKKEEYSVLVEGNEDVIRRISFAPELDGALELCEYLREKGIVAAFAHTEAIYEELMPAVERGCTLATHLYSGMNGVTRRKAHRKLGAVETAMLDERIDVEVIADGHHLPKELLQLIYKIKGADKICLVSDSMSAAGMGEGAATLGGLDCIVKDGVAYLPDFSSFAGSVALADRLIRVMYKDAKIPLCDAVKMMTATPARVMGLSDRGRLCVGCYADLVFFDDDINVERVFIEGNELDRT